MGLQLTTVAGKGSGASADDEAEGERLLTASDQLNYGNLWRIQVSVRGMTCAACSNSMESAILSLNGVVKASVALLQNLAEVTFHPTLLKGDEIKNAIKDAGFEAEILPEISAPNSKPCGNGTLVGQFKIGGRTCAACVNSVEGILLKVTGVKKAVVALSTGLGEVEYDPTVISKDDIINAVEDSGFEALFI